MPPIVVPPTPYQNDRHGLRKKCAFTVIVMPPIVGPPTQAYGLRKKYQFRVINVTPTKFNV